MTGNQLGHTRKNFSLTTKHFTLLLLLLLLVLLLLLTFSFCRHSCHCSFCLLLHPQRNGTRWNQLQHLRIATAAIVLLHLLIASRLHQGCSKVIAVLLHRNKPRNVGCFAILLLHFETHLQSLNGAWCGHLRIMYHGWQSLAMKSIAVEETMFASTE